jgi:hypothetical protein
MNDEIIAIYCLCDDILKAINHRCDPQQQMSDAEVMTTAIVAMLYHSGNFEKARKAMSEPQYIPKMLGSSRFNRRLHRVAPILLTLFEVLGETWKYLNTNSVYSIDSFPIPVCDNIRIPRSKIYGGDEAYRGYQASKKRYFYGIKIHLMVTETGEPVEFFLSSGSFGDVRGLRVFSFNLPEDSVVYADKAYNDYEVEDLLLEAENIKLSAMRKHNSKRPVKGYVQFLQHCKRKVIETTGSLLSQLLPKSIHAVTAKGFELKVMLFTLALSVNLWIAT